MKLTGEETPEELGQKAREIALRQLSMADRTRHQLITAQTTRGIPHEIAEEIADRYEDVGLINDEDYAERFVRSKLAGKPTSKRRLAADMQKKGLDKELIDESLAEVSRDEELANAIRLAEKKARTTTGLEPHVRQRRIFGALARQGFSPDICRQALNHALSGEDEIDESW